MFYMAPEIYQNRVPFYGHLADIWSCGIMLFIMLIGAPPYEQPTDADPRFVRICEAGPSALLDAWGITNISREARGKQRSPACSRHCSSLTTILPAAQI